LLQYCTTISFIFINYLYSNVARKKKKKKKFKSKA
jgi:hypothetical protein